VYSRFLALRRRPMRYPSKAQAKIPIGTPTANPTISARWLFADGRVGYMVGSSVGAATGTVEMRVTVAIDPPVLVVILKEVMVEDALRVGEVAVLIPVVGEVDETIEVVLVVELNRSVDDDVTLAVPGVAVEVATEPDDSDLSEPPFVACRAEEQIHTCARS